MSIEISGRHMDITPALRGAVEDRVGRLKDKQSDVINIHVVLEIQKNDHMAEVVVKTRATQFVAKEKAADLYISIGKAFDSVEAQIRKWRDKHYSNKGH